MASAEETKASGTAPRENAAHILVVDDDQRIRSLIKKFLADNGFRVSTAENADHALSLLSGLDFDLIVLDVMMPGISGIELTRQLRETSAVPILLLTARAAPDERIEGLETGADDYLTKPFEPRELLLRIHNILKRAPDPVQMPKEATIGDMIFYIGRGELRRGDEVIHLTERERELLRIFAAKRGETVSRFDLVEDNVGGNERTIDVQINRLRRKIEEDPANPLRLQTVRGIGYVLMED